MRADSAATACGGICVVSGIPDTLASSHPTATPAGGVPTICNCTSTLEASMATAARARSADSSAPGAVPRTRDRGT
jgi:hypothetical protein